MSVTVSVAVVCEHPGCAGAIERVGTVTVSKVSDASIEARMAEQEAGWATRRKHSGADLCPTHREPST